MPGAYFSPEALSDLGTVFQKAKRILEERGDASPLLLDMVAARIFIAASKGLSPDEILQEILQPSQNSGGVEDGFLSQRPLN